MKTLEEFKNSKGHIVIPLSRVKVVEKFGGFGICDYCSGTDKNGFLIPVLGMKWYCTKCKDDWESKSIFYPEDVSYEYSTAERMMRIITCECGNPEVMYWCAECEANCENPKCDTCESIDTVRDNDYHLNCNK